MWRCSDGIIGNTDEGYDIESETSTSLPVFEVSGTAAYCTVESTVERKQLAVTQQDVAVLSSGLLSHFAVAQLPC